MRQNLKYDVPQYQQSKEATQRQAFPSGTESTKGVNRGSGYKVSKCGLCRIFQTLNWCLAIPVLFVDLENRMKLTKYAWGWHTAHRVTDLARLGCLTRNLGVHHSFR